LFPFPGATGILTSAFLTTGNSSSSSDDESELELDEDEELLDATFARFDGGGCVGSRFGFGAGGGPVVAVSGPLSSESESESESDELEEEDAGRLAGRRVALGGTGSVVELADGAATAGRACSGVEVDTAALTLCTTTSISSHPHRKRFSSWAHSSTSLA
jgi:hypothetical protein